MKAMSIPTPARIALTVGPVLYWWPRQRLLDFYAAIADSAADCVVLGETVCSRRHEMKTADWLALVDPEGTLAVLIWAP